MLSARSRDDVGEAVGLLVDGLGAVAGQQVVVEVDHRGVQATEAGVMTFVLAGSLWTHSHPAPAVREVYAAEPDLTSPFPTFATTLERSLTLFLAGLLSDPDR